MSRLYETLKRVEREHRQPGTPSSEPTRAAEMLNSILSQPVELEGVRLVKVQASPASRLVALTDPKSLGAEKFRALVTRLENLRFQRQMKSLQITSSGINEGKTTVSANLAMTLAKSGKAKVLLIEGDLHRPALASLLGLSELRGLVHWSSASQDEISNYLCRLNSMPLWFLAAGAICDHPSEILQSARFEEAFRKLSTWFDWIVVDSTPMLPVVDANLWSRLVDGSVLVVREGVALMRALKKGLEALDNPKLIGIVLNEASELDRRNYVENYYLAEPQRKGSK